MVIKPKKFKLYCPTVEINSVQIQFVQQVKYLGMLIQEHLCDKSDMFHQLKGLYMRSNVLIKKFGNCSLPVITRLYQTYCTSFYNSFLWCDFNKEHFGKLRVACNNVFRRIFKYSRRESARAMFVSHGLDNFDVIYRKNVISFIERLHISHNRIICALSNNNNIRCGVMWRRWYSSAFSRNDFFC